MSKQRNRFEIFPEYTQLLNRAWKRIIFVLNQTTWGEIPCPLLPLNLKLAKMNMAVAG